MKTLSRKRHLLNSRLRTGVVAVEFAVVAPVFILFLLVSFEFARLNIMRHTADSAAYEAARHAMVPGATATEAIDKANNLLSVVGTNGATVTINPSTLGPGVDEIMVTINIPLDQNGWIAPKFTSGQSIQAQSRLKTERSQ
ncbi:MAG: pilus assembly protein [Planctomycetes bacterium]|nr:pilus assembly protein [Planctomycetota bacterium]